MKTVKVDLNNQCYDILVGSDLLPTVGPWIARHLPNARAAIITDAMVEKHYLPVIERSLTTHNIPSSAIIVAPGEQSKSFATLERVASQILEARLERNDVIIALGGGVVGDLAGFVAGIVRRGMPFIQVPTTLLAQVDSSVGGKTGINTAYGKNLVGIFNQPKLVIADVTTLDSLDKRQFRSGYAELVKYGLINNEGFYRWLEKHWSDVFSGGVARSDAIASACSDKAKIVAEDERETGRRALLNLGHTFGHALETATGYDSNRLIHGEAVAIGIVLAHEFSAFLNLCSPELAKRVNHHFREVGLPTAISDIAGWESFDTQALIDFIRQDKKVTQGKLTFILCKGLGQSFIAKDISEADVSAFLQEKLR